MAACVVAGAEVEVADMRALANVKVAGVNEAEVEVVEGHSWRQK